MLETIFYSNKGVKSNIYLLNLVVLEAPPPPPPKKKKKKKGHCKSAECWNPLNFFFFFTETLGELLQEWVELHTHSCSSGTDIKGILGVSELN